MRTFDWCFLVITIILVVFFVVATHNQDREIDTLKAQIKDLHLSYNRHMDRHHFDSITDDIREKKNECDLP